ncbi:sulfatase family protein [Gracilibacillus dipsosauri]|uniref:Sulfatase n=1 Tax=Gracilibacillus dipsosauri TaxID=178340 RepID=A0A317KV95_9BACI|nr:sulfatase [Gracilibacillus dipsosauri]PWU66600.1 sulfatase [Gracilibacillus dipsosauri]
MKRPNIIFMITHDTGRYLGTYGHQVETPNLDKLAENGVRFDQYYCPAPQCSPSRGSILTGKYPHNNGLIGLAHLGFHINEGETTTPNELRKAGYETSLIGFSHETIGEEEFGQYSSTYKLGFDRYEAIEGARSPQVADKTIEFLKEKADKDDDQPFFANVGFWETHRSFDEYEPLADDVDSINVIDYLPDTPNIRKDLSQFHGSVKVLDEAVGRIMHALEETGLSDNTIVIFTTDHGIAFPRAKGTMKDAGLETALIFYNPALFGKGRVIGDLLCNIDMMPTILELTETAIPDQIDGRSFASLLRGESSVVRNDFFCELTWHDKYHPMRGIRTNQYKYVKNLKDGPKIYMPVDIHRSLSGPDVRKEYYVANEPEELYDLEKDPFEEHNLINDPAYKKVASELREKVSKWMRETKDPLLSGQDIPGVESKKWAEETHKGNTYEAMKK